MSEQYVHAFLFRPPTKCYLRSGCMHFIFCRGREVKLIDKSFLPVTEKEGKGKGKEKWSIGPRMKNGRANATLTICLSTKQTQVCTSIFHTWADAPFHLSLKFFFSHSQDTLVSEFYLSPSTKIQCMFMQVSSRQHHFVGGLRKKKHVHTTVRG